METRQLKKRNRFKFKINLYRVYDTVIPSARKRNKACNYCKSLESKFRPELLCISCKAGYIFCKIVACCKKYTVVGLFVKYCHYEISYFSLFKQIGVLVFDMV